MQKVRLGEYIGQIRGVSYKPTDLHKSLNNDSVILLRANNINEGEINFDDVVYVDKSKVKKEQYLKQGDILVCASSGSKELVGKAAFIKKDIPVTFGAFCKLIRPTGCCAEYLGHYFNSQIYRKKISDLALGANINNIRNEHIDELYLNFPNDLAQKRISEVLDKISLLIDKRKKQLKKLDELVKSRFVEMFGDPVENDKGWQHQAIDKVAPSSAWAGDNSERVWLLNLDMVEAQTGRIIDCLYIEKEQVGTSTHGFDEGNVLYSKLRPYLNKVVVPTKKGYCTTELVPLRPNAMLNRQFLANLLRSEAFVSFIKEKVVGAKMPRVSMNVFREFECILPPLELQEQFAAFVEQIEKVKLHVQKSLQKLETLKQAQMQKYFG